VELRHRQRGGSPLSRADDTVSARGQALVGGQPVRNLQHLNRPELKVGMRCCCPAARGVAAVKSPSRPGGARHERVRRSRWGSE
jgi:hypothetical protein